MKWSSTRWFLPAAVLVAVGVASLVAQVFVLPADAEAEDWRAPAEYVLERIEPEDAINVQPNWNDDPYPYLTEVGDQVLRGHDPLIEDVYRFERLWLMAETSRLDDALERMPYEPAKMREFGSVTVVRLDAPDNPPIATELLDELEEAEVERVEGDDEQSCDLWREDERAWHCGKRNKWVNVRQEFLFMDRDPHRCIWAHPPGGDEKMRVRFPDVELGERFVVRAGLNQKAARSKRGTDVDYRVSIGEEWSEQRTIPADESSWAPLEFDTTELAGKGRDVVVEVSSKSVHERFFCFNGWVFD